MATKLEKDLVRESLESFEGREIMVTLTKNQEVKLKLKGMKSGDVKIGIMELFKQLKGIDDSGASTKKNDAPIAIQNGDTKRHKKSDKMVNLNEFLNELRSSNAISSMDVQTISKFDGIIKDTIDKYK